MIVPGLAVLLVVGIVCWKVYAGVPKKLRPYFWPGLVLKILAGICLGIVYKYYYLSGDTFNYHRDAGLLIALAKKDPSNYLSFLWNEEATITFRDRLIYNDPRALFFTKCISLVGLVTQHNYWINAMLLSVISFFGAWSLVHAIFQHTGTTRAVGALLLFPSVVFWSSGLMKESLAMAALFFLASISLRLYDKKNISYLSIILSLLGVWVLWNLKYYYLAVFIPCVFSVLLVRLVTYSHEIKRAWVIGLWFILFGTQVFLVMWLHPNFYPERFLEVITENHEAYVQLSAPGDRIEYTNLSPTWPSIIRNMPLAIFSILFRPGVWEAANMFQWIAALENSLLLLLTITSLVFIPRILRNGQVLWILCLVMYCVVLGSFLALSTPNFGTLSRYRVGLIPFYILLITYSNPFWNRLWTEVQSSRPRVVK